MCLFPCVQHPQTKALLGFGATDVDAAKGKRKQVLEKRTRRAMQENRLQGMQGQMATAAAAIAAAAAASVSESPRAVGGVPEGCRLARAVHDFNDSVYTGSHWQAGDLPVCAGDLIVVQVPARTTP